MSTKHYILLLGLSVPVMTAMAQNTPPAAVDNAAIQVEPAVAPTIHDNSGWEDCTHYTVSFPEPMVEDEAVGKEVQACNEKGEGGYYSLAGDYTVTATWISTSEFEVDITHNSHERTISRLVIPEGSTALSGKKYAGAYTPIFNSGDVELEISSHHNSEDYRAMFFSSDDVRVAQAVENAYIVPIREGRPVGDAEPANIRQATVGDAVANWKSFCQLCSSEDEEELAQLLQGVAPETPLKGVWCVDFPKLPDADTAMAVYLPHLGSFNRVNEDFDDLRLATFGISSFEATLESVRLSEGNYAVALEFWQPVALDAEKTFRSLNWEIAPKWDDTYTPMQWDEARQAFVGVCKDKEIVLTLDKETTDKAFQEYRDLQNEPVRATKKMRMLVTSPVPGVCLRTVSPFTSIHKKTCGAGLTERDAKNYRIRMTTCLAPGHPIIYSDLISASMRGEGRRHVHCLAEDVDNLKVRVYRIPSQGDAVPRLMAAYSQLYKWGNDDNRTCPNFIEAWYETPAGTNSSVGVPSVLLPGGPEMAETQLTPDEHNECIVDPASLFPGKDPHATYFVEFSGDAAVETARGKRVINQGLVQVTDIGLMWKLSAGRLFAYVYKLSDGKQVETATICMLDANGKKLGEMQVQNGTALGDLPKGVRYLQVQSGTDCYTTRVSPARSRMDNASGDTENFFLWRGFNPADIMEAKSCIFTDRSLYRNGETAHVKGILRFLQGNTLSLPEVESIEAEVRFAGGTTKNFNVTCTEDGTFSLDIPIDDTWYGVGYITFNITYKGDSEGKAKDTEAAYAATSGNLESGVAWNVLERNRRITTELIVQDFRRNEFEVTSDLRVDPETRTAFLGTSAKNFNSAPVAHGKVSWSLEVERLNFYPVKFQEYRFGDQTEGDTGYFSAYYGNGYVGAVEAVYNDDSGALDEKGQGQAELTFEDFEHPGRYRVTSYVSVTNGNEQTLRSTRTVEVEASTVYAGLSNTDKLVKEGEPIRLQGILVTPEGEAYQGEPLPATVTVKRTAFHPYRYGTKLRSSIRNEKLEEDLPTQQIMLSGTPVDVEIPTTYSGVYDITVEGQDPQGKPYYTSIRKYVWGGKVSPWEYKNGTDLELTADKAVYHVGDTAKILVQTPVDAELLVTVEREGVKRHFYKTVTVDKPVLEVPVEAGDGPMVRVSVFLVQGADNRDKNGTPVIKNSFIDLNVDMPEKRLSIQLDTPEKAVAPAEECTLGGVVTDADGNPVAGAELALYAEDEGTLQVMGYTNPEPYDSFYAARMVGVATFNTLGQLIGDISGRADYGNKGIFVGGGDEGSGTDASSERGPRRNFTPCALWLGHVKTDGQGRFSATYTNPDTMTRYRVIAVATAGADKFGAKDATYTVAQAVMLEPSAPLNATEGDRLDVPVTVTMLPEILPPGAPKEIQWNVSMQGTDNPSATQTVTLTGDIPTTIHFPVSVRHTGPMELTWSVVPATMQPGMEKVKDSVALGFNAVPPTPHLRLPVVATLTPGVPVKPADTLEQQLRPDSHAGIMVSLSPLSSAANGVDYLFTYPYGCSEQLSSTLLPWLMKDTLQKWVDVSFPEDVDAGKLEYKTVNQLFARQLSNGGFTYWENGGEASEFSAYVCFVLSGSKIAMASSGLTEKGVGFLKAQLEGDPDSGLLGLLAISRISPETAVQLLSQVYRSRTKWTLADRLLFACSALECHERLKGQVEGDSTFMELMQDSVQEAKTALQTQKPNTPYYSGYTTPPLEALKLYFAIKAGEQPIQELEQPMRQFINRSMVQPGYFSTWRNAWACVVIDEFCKVYQGAVDTTPVTVNGQTVELGKPLRLKGELQTMPDIVTEGTSKAFLSGLVVGYTVAPQDIRVVDHGFVVQRRYEKLQPDGTWVPTGTFNVGDIVRVTFTAKATKKEPGCYMVAEDRLPAGFEVVNPELGSQGLPDFISNNKGAYWYFPAFVNKTEYHKDRVVFFATSFFGNPQMEASYIARVVKSGRMTAPAAKVEMMYTPDVYGLSIPQEFEVKPRK